MPLEKPKTMITTPGVYEMPIDQYHGDCCDGPSLSSSPIRTMITGGPDLYWMNSIYNPARVPEADSDALRFGRAYHTAILEPHLWGEDVTISPYEEFRTKEARAWKATAEEKRITWLKKSEADKIQAMRQALRANPKFQNALSQGRAEQSIFWKDEESGLWLKTRLDWVPTAKKRLIVDLKTTSDIVQFARSMIRYRYDIQAVLQMDGVEKMLDIEPVGVAHLVQETSAPYRAQLFYWSLECPRVRQTFEMARADIREAIGIFQHGMETGDWPMKGQAITKIEIPNYFLERANG